MGLSTVCASNNIIGICIVFGIFTCICIVMIVYFNLKIQRSGQVLKFRNQCADLSGEYDKRRLREGKAITFTDESAFVWFYGKYTFQDFMKGWKPLTLETWYTKEEIERVQS